jgi:hypothetical protein
MPVTAAAVVYVSGNESKATKVLPNTGKMALRYRLPMVHKMHLLIQFLCRV